MSYLAWAVWACSLLFVLGCAWELFKTYTGRLPSEERAKYQHDIEKTGKTVYVLLDWAGIVALVILLFIPLVTDMSTLHLIWLFPLVIVMQVLLHHVIGGLGQRIAEDWKPQMNLIWTGLLLILMFGLLTVLQLSRIEHETAWAIFRIWFIPIPVIVLTALGCVVGLCVFLKGIWGR